MLAEARSDPSRYIAYNANCDWQEFTEPQLKLLTTHEVGHYVIGPGHSPDKHSVMYPLFNGQKQVITKRDRAMAGISMFLRGVQ